jgi:hypothetical protein
MKNKSIVIAEILGVISLLIFDSACSPYEYTLRHFCILETPYLKILERSTTNTTNSAGEKIYLGKVGLPLKARLERGKYFITIFTPLANGPVVSMTIKSTDQKILHIVGNNITSDDIKELKPGSDCHYWFDAARANGSSMKFSVIDSKGISVGEEKLKYKIINRGYIIGVDTL